MDKVFVHDDNYGPFIEFQLSENVYTQKNGNIVTYSKNLPSLKILGNPTSINDENGQNSEELLIYNVIFPVIKEIRIPYENVYKIIAKIDLILKLFLHSSISVLISNLLNNGSLDIEAIESRVYATLKSPLFFGRLV